MPAKTLSASEEPDFRLDDWWVRPRRNALERGEEIIHLEARSMAVLVCLAERAPKVVTKERLLAECWADGPHVGEEVISHAIWELRKAFGDSARDPSFIQTVPRKGYRLMKEVARPSGSALPMDGVRIGHYTIGKELGQGAMGTVYEALDHRLERPVAIKFLAPELTRDVRACRRFEREARLAAALDHPNLATVHEIGETSRGQRFLVTPLYRGGSLKERIADGPIPRDEALDLARQLAAGLGAAHDRGIVHRDIKPANLLLDEHGTLKVADFGIAKLIGGTDLTRTGATLGTPAYKSPEQSRGEAVDHRTDIWSIGVVLFELLTGRRPFDGEYEHAVVHAILEKSPEPLEDVDGEPIPDALRAVIGKAMAKDPADRFQSTSELVEALGSPVPLGFGTDAPARPGWALPRPVIVGLLVMASIGLAYSFLWPRVPGPQVDLQGDLEASASMASALPASPSSDSQAYWLLGQAKVSWLEGNDPDNLRKVEKLLEQAAHLAPDRTDILAHRAIFHAQRLALFESDDDRTLTTELLETLRSRDPSNSLADVVDARLAIENGEYGRAHELASRAMKANPHCQTDASCDLAYLLTAEALWYLRHEEKAEEVLLRGIEVGSGFIRCRLMLAQLYESWAHYEEAILEYKKVLDLVEDQTTALNDLGTLYLDLGRYFAAAGMFRSLADQTGDPDAIVNLGHALYGLEHWEDAEAEYLDSHQKYVALGSLVPTPHVSIGDIYLELESPEKAAPWFSMALETFSEMEARPNFSNRRQGQMAVCLAKLGQFSRALDKINPLLSEAAADSILWVYLARIHALAGNREELFAIAKRSVAAGQSPRLFINDAAFRGYRADPDYSRLLEPTPRR